MAARGRRPRGAAARGFPGEPSSRATRLSTKLPPRTCTRNAPSASRRAGRSPDTETGTDPGRRAPARRTSRARPETSRASRVSTNGGTPSAMWRNTCRRRLSTPEAGVLVRAQPQQPVGLPSRDGDAPALQGQLHEADGRGYGQRLRHPRPLEPATHSMSPGRQPKHRHSSARRRRRRLAVDHEVEGPALFVTRQAQLRRPIRPHLDLEASARGPELELQPARPGANRLALDGRTAVGGKLVQDPGHPGNERRRQRIAGNRLSGGQPRQQSEHGKPGEASAHGHLPDLGSSTRQGYGLFQVRGGSFLPSDRASTEPWPVRRSVALQGPAGPADSRETRGGLLPLVGPSPTPPTRGRKASVVAVRAERSPRRRS